MTSETCWLPDLEYYEGYDSWLDYEDTLYDIFKTDFIDSYPFFENKRVKIKKYQTERGRAKAFYHTTCKDYLGSGDRAPDLRRCERIRWIRAFIENYDCDESLCDSCSGVKVWREPYKNKNRVNILLEEERYIVILEDRLNFYLLITAFYLDYDNALEKRLKHYEMYKKLL